MFANPSRRVARPVRCIGTLTINFRVWSQMKARRSFRLRDHVVQRRAVDKPGGIAKLGKYWRIAGFLMCTLPFVRQLPRC